MFSWMYWTTPIAVFFIVIIFMLVGMTIWEVKSPTGMRKGFLPIPTTRGDRLFIGLLSAAFFNLAFVGLGGVFTDWFSLSEEPTVWISFIASIGLLFLVMRKG
jgi:predicted small integral membrane protein